MKVTVRECLQMDAFKQSVVVAGERNLDNRIKSISVMDAENATEACAYNGNEEELVLTTFSVINLLSSHIINFIIKKILSHAHRAIGGYQAGNAFFLHTTGSKEPCTVK